MTLPQNVKDAARLLDQFFAGQRNILGDYWGRDMAAMKFSEVQARLMSQEAEVDRLKKDSLDGQFDYIALRDRLDQAESRLAAANALLRYCTAFMAIRHSDMYDEIQTYLQGSGDEA